MSQAHRYRKYSDTLSNPSQHRNEHSSQNTNTKRFHSGESIPTETPNATARAIAEKQNSFSAFPSPDGHWAALDSQPGILRIVQVNGDKDYTIPCDTFSTCEFVDALQWSPDGKTLYFAPLLTGETNIPFDLYTGIARINVDTGTVEKLVEDSSSDMEYAFSLSPDGKYFAYTDMKEQHPQLTVIETEHLQKVFNQFVDHGSAAGNLLWTPDSQEIFLSL